MDGEGLSPSLPGPGKEPGWILLYAFRGPTEVISSSPRKEKAGAMPAVPVGR